VLPRCREPQYRVRQCLLSGTLTLYHRNSEPCCLQHLSIITSLGNRHDVLPTKSSDELQLGVMHAETRVLRRFGQLAHRLYAVVAARISWLNSDATDAVLQSVS